MKHSLTVPAKAEYLPQVQDFLLARLRGLSCSLKTETQISLAAEEIFVNICHYAYPDAEGEVFIEAEVTSAPAITILFRDRGIPYDPLARSEPDITLSAQERPIGGLGIYLVKQAADELSYNYQNGYNTLRFTKKLKVKS